MLDKTLKKLRRLEKAISEEKGPFDLFALFLRHESLMVWDVIVSAPWLVADEAAGLDYLAGKLQKNLTPQELVNISRIVILDEDNPIVKSVQDSVAVEHEKCEMPARFFNGMYIRHAYIFTSRRKNRVA